MVVHCCGESKADQLVAVTVVAFTTAAVVECTAVHDERTMSNIIFELRVRGGQIALSSEDSATYVNHLNFGRRQPYLWNG